MKQHEEISIRLQEEREKLAIQRQVIASPWMGLWVGWFPRFSVKHGE